MVDGKEQRIGRMAGLSFPKTIKDLTKYFNGLSPENQWNKLNDLKTYKTAIYEIILSDKGTNDEKIKQIIDNMVQIDQRIPHSARPKGLKKFPEHPLKSYVYKRPARLGILKKPNEH